MLIHQVTLFLKLSLGRGLQLLPKAWAVDTPVRLLFSNLVFIVHVCSCPSASKRENRAVVEARVYHRCRTLFFHRCNGKTDLSPRSHFISNDNDSCWKTFIATGKINVPFCQSRLDVFYLSCPSICPLYDALFFASVISSVSNPSISLTKLSEWKFMDYRGICFVDLFGLSR